MRDENKTKAQLIEELGELRRRVDEVEEKAGFQTNLLRAAGQAIMATDLAGTILFMNRFAEELYGWSAAEAIGHNIIKVTVPQPTREQAEEIMTILRKGERWQGEFLVQHRDGTSFPAMVTDTPIHDANGEVVGVIGVSSDLTERKLAECALREREAQVRQEKDFAESLIETAQAIILVLDTAGRIVRFNPYMEELSGYRLEEVQGKDWFSTFLPKRDQDSIRSLFLTAVDGIQTSGNVNPIVTRDGHEREIEWYDKTLRDADGNSVGLLAVGQDITERKQMEQELIRLERLRAVGELSAGISHNLNNMLSTVLGPAQLLLRLSEEPDIRREAEEIIDSGRRARDLVQRLSQAVRGEPEGTLYGVSVNEVVQQVVQASRPRWQDEAEAQGMAIEIITELGAVPDIPGTSTELHDVLLNLLLNAVEAMPEGGTITFRTQAVDEAVQLTLTDTGIGMDEATRRRVFEPFFTTKMDIGTGLGMATVYGTVTRWGGRIDVESTPGQGTTFTLRFPSWTEPEGQEEETAADLHPGRAGRVLIVEDDDATCRLLSRLLGERHEVATVLNGREALGSFAPGRYDVVLIDLGMPGIPGDRVAREMRQADPELVTVLITGWDIKPGDPKLTRFDFQIQKPFDDLDEIEDVVARAMAVHDRRTGEKS